MRKIAKISAIFFLFQFIFIFNVLAEERYNIIVINAKKPNIKMAVYRTNLAFITENADFSVKSDGLYTILYENIPRSVVQGSTMVHFSDKRAKLISEEYKHNKNYFSKSSAVFGTKHGLLWKVYLKKGRQSVKLSYLTRNISWDGGYILYLKSERLMDMRGWMIIKNNTDMNYENPKIYAVAGNVNSSIPRFKSVSRNYLSRSASGWGNIKNIESFNYHLYKIPSQETIYAKQSKQIDFINLESVKYKVKAVSDLQYPYTGFGSRDIHFKSMLVFKNSKSNNLGIPMPEGIVRVYKADKAENIIYFAGSDRINNTPKDADVKIRIGRPFDITAHNKQIKYENNRSFIKSTVKTTVKNSSNKESEIEIICSKYSSADKITTNCSNRCAMVQENAKVVKFIITLAKNKTYTFTTEFLHQKPHIKIKY